MHRNRLIYTLPEYQQKIRKNYKKLGLFLERNEDHKIFIFRPVPCSPWLPESRKKYFGKLMNRASSLPANKKYSFATLTYSSRLYSPVDSCKRIKHDIDLFFKRLGYHHRKVQYFYVIELTDNFMPHIHIIFDQFIPWKKIRSSWFNVTGNTVTDIRKKSRGSALHYCIYYLTKAKKQDESKFSFLFSHVDRIWTASRGFIASASSRSGKYKFIFSVWDPDGYLHPGFEDPEKDLISNEVEKHDAVYIAGFSERIDGIKVMNQVPDWVFMTVDDTNDLGPKGLVMPARSFETMFDFYNKS